MPEEQPTADKILQEIKAIEKKWPLIRKASWSLIRSHPLISILVAIILACLGYDYLFGMRTENRQLKRDIATNSATFTSYQAENTRLNRQVQDQQAVLADVKTERNKAQSDLAPWVLLAKSTFSNAPPDKRLDLLLEKVEPLAKVLERIDALTNSPRPKIEVWADGLLLANGMYKLPVDSNGVGSISFVLKNSGESVAENVSISVQSVTNITLSGWEWKTPPRLAGEMPASYVMTEIPGSINPDARFLVSTLRISNDSILGPFEPLTLFASTSRSKTEIRLMCVALPGVGKLTPATISVQTNTIIIGPVDFRQ